eukprot:IDg23442t1
MPLAVECIGPRSEHRPARYVVLSIKIRCSFSSDAVPLARAIGIEETVGLVVCASALIRKRYKERGVISATSRCTTSAVCASATDLNCDPATCVLSFSNAKAHLRCSSTGLSTS